LQSGRKSDGMNPVKFLWSRVPEAFDAWQPSYESDASRMIEKRGYSYRRMADEILATLALNAGHPKRVLEIGTGTGNLGMEVLATNKSITAIGIDISTRMAAAAAARGIYSGVVRASVEQIPFPEETFDAIFTAFVLHSVWDQIRAMREIRRVLRPGGRVALIDLCPVRRSMVVGTTLGLFHALVREYGAPARYRRVDEYVRISVELGFEVTAVRPLGGPRRYMHFLVGLQKVR